MGITPDGGRTCTGRIVWNGITNPEDKEVDGVKKRIYSLKIVIKPGSPEIQELEDLVQKKLDEHSKFQGHLPSGGNYPVKVVEKGKLVPSVEGFIAINAKTQNGVPQVWDDHGKLLESMVYGPKLYNGSTVRIAVGAYAYVEFGGGVTFNLSGIQIVDATTPAFDIGSKGIDAAAAFGIGTQSAPTPPPVPGAATPPPPPHPGFVDGPRIMTAKANGSTYQSFKDLGWTDEQLETEGYVEKLDK